MKRCLHQIIKPSRKNLRNPPGIGECVDCKYDPKENKKCKKYTPVNLEVVTCTNDDHIQEPSELG